MTSPMPPPSPRTLAGYHRLIKPLAALARLTRGKPAGPFGPATIARCNRVIAAANAVFSRETDYTSLPRLAADAVLTPVDLAIIVDELLLAAITFEESHAPPEEEEEEWHHDFD